MLLEIHGGMDFGTFSELFEYTKHLINRARDQKANIHKRTTIVFGPVTAYTEVDKERNLHLLRAHGCMLADSGIWLVLCRASLQLHIDRLLLKLRVAGYPEVVIREVTVPLILSGCLDALHFRRVYINSIGATQEHNIACSVDIPRIYLP